MGDLSSLPLLQIDGAIGADSSDPIAFDPADVNLYHFQISDAGQHEFIAEVFAGRIGSPLYAGLSLFQAGANGQLQLLASNSGTLNGTPATNGQVPLFNDPVLYAGLVQGDYYLAVSGLGNVPDPVLGPALRAEALHDRLKVEHFLHVARHELAHFVDDKHQSLARATPLHQVSCSLGELPWTDVRLVLDRLHPRVSHRVRGRIKAVKYPASFAEGERNLALLL